MSNLTFTEAVRKARAQGWTWDATREFVRDTAHLVPHDYCLCGDKYALSKDHTGYRPPPVPVYCSNECGLRLAGTDFFSVAGKLPFLAADSPD